MFGYALLAAVAFVAYQSVKYMIAWRRNVALAKASGIPYVVVPLYVYSLFMLLFNRPATNLMRKLLPSAWTRPWLDLVVPLHSWHTLYAAFKDIGSDTYLTVAPGGIMLWTCDADVIAQMTTRRGDFPKPTEFYTNIDIFGKNVVSSEGQYWRHHRKIVAPPFAEKNNNLVWEESIHQGLEMMKKWAGADGNEAKAVRTAPEDTMRVSLHIISRAGFGQRLTWPGSDENELVRTQSGKEATMNKWPGHELSYFDALSGLLENLVWVVAGGKLLDKLPFEKTKHARQTFLEWRAYMTDMLQSKQAEVDSGAEQTGMDLLGAMIRSAQNSDTGKPLLSDEEILGNAFVFILAGHETTANSIHYSLIYLACNPAMQKKLQADVDDIFQGRKPEEWNYDHDLPKLFSGMVGATMNEQLRLIPPVIEIPKCTRTVQPITIDGKRCTVPANVLINLSTAAAHRNPNSWPHGPPSDPSKPSHPVSNLHNDLEEFKPDRWLLSGGNSAQQAPKHSSKARTEHSEDEQDATGGPTGDTAASLWKPVKGSYLPFSEGARSCIGKRFAQVEVLAVLAVIFNEWSVELALDDFASEEELAKMNESEKKQVWEKARDRAMWVFREKMQSRITLKMQSEIHTPLRFVRRGREDSARM